ncbi:Primary ciliary dyskinesia protein 1 [Tupaia chinensis]|uniref:Primary ciliary dyskinesia protein 1 n=1 Tax=Tupaia chinensis TaxID=246437 RepID=L8Y7E8_TUPCH|nr:Primary ciliary dyskinesia protein 1 [Tupaia chinensis]
MESGPKSLSESQNISLIALSAEIEYQNLKFPVDLSNPFAVATVLNQEPGKLKIKELKEDLAGSMAAATLPVGSDLGQRSQPMVMVQRRLLSLLASVRKMDKESIRKSSQGKPSLVPGKYPSKHLLPQISQDDYFDWFSVLPQEVLPFAFPSYSPSQGSNELAPDGLGLVPIKSSEVQIKQGYSFFNLQVPQLYKIKRYQPFSVHKSSTSYRPQKLARALKQGAEDEVTTIIALPEQESTPQLSDKPSILSMKPPEALALTPDYDRLYIFNPNPGLFPVMRPLTYAETLIDYHLCSHPKYKFTKETHDGSSIPLTQKQFLHHTDIIPGIMHWKKFQSLALSSLPNTAKLEATQSELCEQNVEVTLTPEMIQAEFPILDHKDTKKEKEAKDQAQPAEKVREKVVEETRNLRSKALNASLILE